MNAILSESFVSAARDTAKASDAAVPQPQRSAAFPSRDLKHLRKHAILDVIF